MPNRILVCFVAGLLAFNSVDSGEDAEPLTVGATRKPKSSQWLSQKVNIHVESIGELESQLRQQNLPIYIDWHSLADSGIDRDLQILIAADTIDDLLQAWLLDGEFSYELKDQFIRLTTRYATEERLRLTLYHVAPLVDDIESLVFLIQETIDVHSWDELGGPGSIVPMNGLLAISASDCTHQKVDQLLHALARAKQVHATPKAMRVSLASIDFDTHQRILNTLQQPRQLKVSDPTKLTIDRLADAIQSEVEMTVWIDHRALEMEGLTADEPIEYLPAALTLDQQLTQSLAPLGLEYWVANNVMVISSYDGADRRLNCSVYPVSDLVMSPVAIAGRAIDVSDFVEGGGAPYLSTAASTEFTLIDGIKPPRGTYSPSKLLDAITGTIEPGEWEEMGGPGVIRYHALSGSLVVTSHEQVHQKIMKLLTELRRLLPIQPRGIEKTIPLEQQFVTVAFRLANDVDQRADAESLIRSICDPPSWQNPRAMVTRSKQTLVVRQTVRSMIQIRKLLRKTQLVDAIPIQLQHPSGGMF